MLRISYLAVLISLLISCISSQANAELDQATRDKMARIQAAVSSRMDGWRFKIGETKGAESPDFDDSSWEVVNINHEWQGENTYAYFRKTIALPNNKLGKLLEGTKIVIRVSVDDEGEVFVNGEKRGGFYWVSGNFLVIEHAKIGEKYQVTIKAHNSGGGGRLILADCDMEGMTPIRDKIYSILGGFPSVEEHLNQFPRDRSRWEKLLTGAVDVLDEDALNNGDIDAFYASAKKAEEILQPLSQVFKRYKVDLVGQSHIDMAWLWPWKETVGVCIMTYGSALGLINEFPDFKFTQSQAVSYQWIEKERPDLFAQIQQRVKEGRWEIVGGQWVEPDCNLPNGESHIRQFLYGKRYFKEKFGVDCRVAWLPDSFGYAWTLPQIFKGCGMDYFMTTKMSWDEETPFPYQVFQWQSPDGTQVLAYEPMTGAQAVEPSNISFTAFNYQRDTGSSELMYLYGVGDHGGGPTREMCENARKLKNTLLAPTVTQTSALDWFEKIKNNPDIPIYNNELYLENHRGTYTSQAKTKLNNRRAECMLTNTEKFAAFASLYGKAYPHSDFEEMWRKALFNQFHDILPGSAIHQVYEDAQADYDVVFANCKKVQDDSLRFLSDKINTSAAKKPLIVYNPLSWNVTGPVTADGKTLIAHDVPAMGYKVVDMSRSEKPVSKVVVSHKDRDIELSNGIITARINKFTGFISYIADKSGVNRLTALGNKLQAFEEKIPGTDAWNIRYGYEKYQPPMPAPKSVEIVQTSDEVAVVKVKRSFRSSTIEQDYILCADSPRLDIHTLADWHEKNVMLKAAFPINTKAAEATYEIAYGSIKRSTRFETPDEKARFEVNGQQWVDMSDENGGLSILNDCKYGYDALGQNMRITLLRCPDNPDPHADEGLNEFTYSLYPHAGALDAEAAAKQARELNNPLIAYSDKPHTGTLPASHSFASLSGGGLVEALKVAEDGNDLVARIVEYNGKTYNSVLTLDSAKSARLTNMIEQGGTEVPVTNGAIPIELKPYKIDTIMIHCGK